MDGNIEQALGGLKAELELLDSNIQQLGKKSDELRPFVRDFEETRKKVKGLKAKRKSLYSQIRIISDFFKQATGSFPDGMYPLFQKEEAA